MFQASLRTSDANEAKVRGIAGALGVKARAPARKRRTTMEMLIILLALTTIAVPALTEFAVRFSQAPDR